MRILLATALLATSVTAVAHDDNKGYWGDSTTKQIWRNSYGECWQSGIATKDQLSLGCGGKAAAAAPAAAPVAAVDDGAAARAAADKAAADAKAAAAAAAATAVAAAPVVAAVVLDGDKDGVADANDKCPDSKPGAKVDENGCYLVLKEKVTIAINVKFPTGSSRVDAAGDAEIKKLADFMTEYPQTSVEIGGHTDNTGAAAMNTKLSQARASAVRQRLIDKFGIAGDRVTAKGYGPDKPVADNGTAEGRTANRRVEGVVDQVVEKVQN